MTPAWRSRTSIFVLCGAFFAGGAGSLFWGGGSGDEQASEVDAGSTTTVTSSLADATSNSSAVSTVTEPIATTTTTTTTVPVPATEPLVLILPVEPPTADAALAMANSLAGEAVLPSDCGVPYDVAESLPNSARDYRSGIHQGIDFICLERGRDAVSALPGRVVMAVGDYVDPEPADREAVLGIAGLAGVTPAHTLTMLYGNYVVVDHGIVPDVGHVASIYAHLEELDPAMLPGVEVTAGQRLGEIGNRGTDSAARDTERPQSIHLHWELHVDGLYLAAGLDSGQTAEVYRALFAR